jgi:hypothetical protein
MNRARIGAPQAYRPVELKAKPVTGLPLRTTSVVTATTEVVISEKSKAAFRIVDLTGTAFSEMAVMRNFDPIALQRFPLILDHLVIQYERKTP